MTWAGRTWELPGYEVVELVGFGACGEVWRGRATATGEQVALKRLRAADAVARERLRREAAVLSSVAGEHVVRVRDVVLTGSDAVLVMDYAAGGSLASVIAVRRQLAGPEVVTLVAPLAMALADAHDRGIVHGDVSPANIVFTADGRPLLSDFGVARAVGTVTDVVEGTPPYLAPELLAGQPATPAADVYALCTIAAEVLATPSAPDALVAAVRSGLADDPHDRPSARDLAAAVLRSCAAAPVGLVRASAPPVSVVTQGVRVRPSLGSAPGEQPPPRPVRPGRSRGKRRRAARRPLRVPARLVGSGVVLGALLLAVAGGVMWGHRTQSSAAVLPRPPAQPAMSPPTSPSVDWTAVVARLALARAHALTADEPAALEAVYAPGGAALVADRAALLRLTARHLRPAGLVITTQRVEPVGVTASRATLRVTDVLSAYTLVRTDGRVVGRISATPARTFTMLLVRTGVGWRIAAIHP